MYHWNPLADIIGVRHALRQQNTEKNIVLILKAFQRKQLKKFSLRSYWLIFSDRQEIMEEFLKKVESAIKEKYYRQEIAETGKAIADIYNQKANCLI